MTEGISIADLRTIAADLPDAWRVVGQPDGSLALVDATGARVGRLAAQPPPAYDPATEVPPLAVRVDLVTDKAPA